MGGRWRRLLRWFSATALSIALLLAVRTYRGQAHHAHDRRDEALIQISMASEEGDTTRALELIHSYISAVDAEDYRFYLFAGDLYTSDSRFAEAKDSYEQALEKLAVELKQTPDKSFDKMVMRTAVVTIGAKRDAVARGRKWSQRVPRSSTLIQGGRR